MAPGPLFAANVSWGLRGGTKSGLKMAIGHTIVEFPLVILLGIGVFSLELFPEFRIIISIFGAIALFIFGIHANQDNIKKKRINHINSKARAIANRSVTKCTKPFFLVWWLTIGFKLISDAMLVWAFAGILVVFVFHIWMDFVWLGTISFLASKSTKILSNRNYKILMTGLSLVLVYFGITFLTDGLL